MKPSREYQTPSYVTYFMLGGLISFISGVVLVIIAVNEGSSPWPAVAFFSAGIVSFIYAQIAEAIARTHWRVELLAHDLAAVVEETTIQGERRIKAEREAARKQDEDIRRVLAAKDQQLGSAQTA